MGAVPHGYTGQPLRVAEDPDHPVGLSRPDLVDGMAQCHRELAEVQAGAQGRDLTPAEQDRWDETIARFGRLQAAVLAIDNAPAD